MCKLGGTIPLAPGCTRVTNKHMPALYPYWLLGLISARQEVLVSWEESEPFPVSVRGLKVPKCRSGWAGGCSRAQNAGRGSQKNCVLPGFLQLGGTTSPSVGTALLLLLLWAEPNGAKRIPAERVPALGCDNHHLISPLGNTLPKRGEGELPSCF